MTFLPWRELKRSWSVWLLSVGIAFNGFIQIFPEQAAIAWQQMPTEIKQQIPEDLAGQITLALYVLTFIARSLKQKDLD